MTLSEPADGGDEAGDGVEVRGAEPYRFEPLRGPARDDAEAQAAGGEDDEDRDRLLNTDW